MQGKPSTRAYWLAATAAAVVGTPVLIAVLPALAYESTLVLGFMAVAYSGFRTYETWG